ncbi:MAG TPA: mycothiol system anti-sigma-R factor [Longimicrobiales bacterium]|nr:mycothiol system anti-sigma-R factor [Longimicrobiales bacterium]
MKDEAASCRETMDRLWELLDSELHGPDSERLQAHLDRCQSCFPQYDFQRAYRAFVASCCRHDAPPELRRRIFMALLEEESRGG